MRKSRVDLRDNARSCHKVYKPLRPLEFLPIAVTYQMLHWRNILTGYFIYMLY